MSRLRTPHVTPASFTCLSYRIKKSWSPTLALVWKSKNYLHSFLKDKLITWNGPPIWLVCEIDYVISAPGIVWHLSEHSCQKIINHLEFYDAFWCNKRTVPATKPGVSTNVSVNINPDLTIHKLVIFGGRPALSLYHSENESWIPHRFSNRGHIRSTPHNSVLACCWYDVSRLGWLEGFLLST